MGNYFKNNYTTDDPALEDDNPYPELAQNNPNTAVIPAEKKTKGILDQLSDNLRPAGEWAGNQIRSAGEWAGKKLNQEFTPFFEIEPLNLEFEFEKKPGILVEAWNKRFPEKTDPNAIPFEEMQCRNAVPGEKIRDEQGIATMRQKTFSPQQGLIGTTRYPCVKERDKETFSQDFKNTMSSSVDWLNKGGAAIEASNTPEEAKNWGKQLSMQVEKKYEPRPSRRDYGIEPNQEFTINRAYKAGLAKDLSDQLMDPVYGEAGQLYAAELRNKHVLTNSPVNGEALWDRLKNDFGTNQAADIISRLEYFSGVRGHPTFSGNEVYQFTPSIAEKAIEDMEKETLHPEYESYGYDYEKGADPRQYGEPKDSVFSPYKQYNMEMMEDIRRILNDPRYGTRGKDLSGKFIEYYINENEPKTGAEIYNNLANYFGHEKAIEIINKLDYFTGMHDVPSPQSGYQETGDFDLENRPGQSGYPRLFK